MLFWKIPREFNHEADAAAKAASLYGFREPEFVDWVIRQPQLPNLPTEMAPVKPWKRVVVLCPDSKSLVDYRYQSLLSRIRRNTVVELGQTTQQSLRLLEERASPSVILITDNAICWNPFQLFPPVLNHLRKGSTVVLTGDFGRSSAEAIDWAFDKFGVTWRLGDTTRETGIKARS